MSEITAVASAFVEALAQMGKETAACEGLTCGLRGYPWLHDKLPEVKKFRYTRWEEPFWEGLSHRLKIAGIHAKPEEWYPGSKERCDLVVDLPGMKPIWIEGKLVMEHYWVWDQSSSLYYWQNSKPKHGDWDKALADVGGKDLRKLKSLTSSQASHIGILILGFDRTGGALEERRFYDSLPNEVVREWSPFHSAEQGLCWPDHCKAGADFGFRDRFWFWSRTVQ